MKDQKWAIALQCSPVASFTLEDCRITRIESDQKCVRFLFANGVWDSVKNAHTSCPAQLAVQCSMEDVLVTVYHKHRLGERKWCSLSYPSIADINSALDRNQFEIEVSLCLSSDQRLFLRGGWGKYTIEFDLLNVKEAYICFQ